VPDEPELDPNFVAENPLPVRAVSQAATDGIVINGDHFTILR
jgi:hypothetical protein